MYRGQIRRVFILVLLTLVVILGYISYLQIWNRTFLAEHQLNPRPWLIEQEAERGTIKDRHGITLAATVLADGKPRRLYKSSISTAQLIGYLDRRLGKSGIEAAYNRELQGQTGWRRVENTFRRLSGQKQIGFSLVLALDSKVQQSAQQFLGNRRGAVVAVEVPSGAVLVMASAPAHDPNNLVKEWDRIREDAGSPLLNRATTGLYPPGSTLKLVTGANAVMGNPKLQQETFYCPGEVEVRGRRITCPQPHGDVNLTQALAVSCNVTFARLGLNMGPKAFAQGADSFGFNRKIPFDLPLAPGRVSPPGQLAPSLLAESAIGQGEVLATPLLMAMIAATIANQGVMMQPYLVEEVQDDQQNSVRRARPRVMGTPVDKTTAKFIGEAMAAVVSHGTGQAALTSELPIAGKTGTAENSQGAPHAWFVGYAPVEAPQVAIAVIIENGGPGGLMATPLAREVLMQMLASGR